jgi:hypothetical protein
MSARCHPDQSGSSHDTGPLTWGPKSSSALPPLSVIRPEQLASFQASSPFLPIWQEISVFGNLDFFFFLSALVCVKNRLCPVEMVKEGRE